MGHNLKGREVNFDEVAMTGGPTPKNRFRQNKRSRKINSPPPLTLLPSSTMSSVYPRKTKVVDPDAAPIDSNIPDNYVAHTLKTQKPLPPITWSNWWKELNWLSFSILTLTPTFGIIGAMFTKLRWETLLFSIFYYYVTGLGKFSFAPLALKYLNTLQVLPRVTTVSGLIALTMLPSLCNTSSPLLALVQLRVPSSGGLVVTELTTGILTLSSTLTTLTKAFTGVTSVGCWSNPVESLALPMSVTSAGTMSSNSSIVTMFPLSY